MLQERRLKILYAEHFERSEISEYWTLFIFSINSASRLVIEQNNFESRLFHRCD